MLTQRLSTCSRLLVIDQVSCSENGCHKPRKAALKVIQTKVVPMHISDHIDPKQAGVNHGLEMVRHARFRPSQTQCATGEVPAGSEHADKLQPHRIAQRLKHLRQLHILYPWVENDLHFDIVADKD